MASGYARTARQILKMVGGKANVESLTHCTTGLRFMLEDTGLPKGSEMEKVLGISRVIRQGGQCQVVIGNEITHVFAKLQKLGDFSDGGGAENDGPRENPFSRLCVFVAGCMRECEKKSVD